MNESSKTGFSPIDEYLQGQEEQVRLRLYRICTAVRKEVPGAEGRISYKMPAYFYHGRLVYFCAFKNHIGFYPASMNVFEAFREELKDYKQSGRGTVQFPYERALPIALIRKIVKFRARENEKKEFAENKR